MSISFTEVCHWSWKISMVLGDQSPISFSQMAQFRKEQNRSFQRPPLKMSTQSFPFASFRDPMLGSPGYQFVKFKAAFEWSHINVPSTSRSFRPIHAVQSNIFVGQFSEITWHVIEVVYLSSSTNCTSIWRYSWKKSVCLAIHLKNKQQSYKKSWWNSSAARLWISTSMHID